MKKMLAAALSVVVVFVAAALAQTAGGDAVKRLTDEGARAYRSGRFAEAQRIFERALELDPRSKVLPLFIARSLHQQYKPGVDAPENRAVGEAAVEAYKKFLRHEDVEASREDNSFGAVAYLYRLMGDEAREREWLLARAGDASAPNEKRSFAFAVLASKQWNCSYGITEQKENKETIERGAVLAIRYKMPRRRDDFERARACAADGMRLAEQALLLTPEYVNAWAYKTNLLREMAKLAQMENDKAASAEYTRRAEEAELVHKRLRSEAERKKESERDAPQAADATGREAIALVAEPDMLSFVTAATHVAGTVVTSVAPPVVVDSGDEPPPPPPPRPTPPADSTRRRNTIVPAGILNGKAISRPAPSYPVEARNARVTGSVTVRILIDEDGRVIKAEAVSGHPLLSEEAVKTARKWRFSPTLLSGQPVKVSGTIVLNFTLR